MEFSDRGQTQPLSSGSEELPESLGPWAPGMHHAARGSSLCNLGSHGSEEECMTRKR